MQVRDLQFNAIREVNFVAVMNDQNVEERFGFYEFADGTIIKAKENSNLAKVFGYILQAQIQMHEGEEETTVNFVWKP